LEAVLSRFNSVELHKMITLINNNNRVYEYWKDKVDGLKKYEAGYPRLLKDPNAFIERFKHCIDTKKSDILSSVSLAKDIEEDINALNKFISNYNKFIKQESEKIDLWKKGLAAENSVELKRQISILETTKIRYSDEVKPLVDKLLTAEKKIKKLNEKRR
jgi:alpha-galactosidase/6-phospho-beta-glucosidase family protein